MAEFMNEEARTVMDCSEETEAEGSFNRGVKCRYNGVQYHAGSELEMTVLARDTMIIEEDYAKIVLVDVGSFWSKEVEARNLMHTIIDAEGDRDVLDGKPKTRLIFLRQDRDYWPGSEDDPLVMARRAMKELEEASYGRKPEYSELFVPLRLPREEGWNDGSYRETFRRYFDPRLPGTRFIINNMCPVLTNEFHYCMQDPDLRDIWLGSPLAGIIQIERSDI